MIKTKNIKYVVLKNNEIIFVHAIQQCIYILYK